jgi:cardiolipin synthase
VAISKGRRALVVVGTVVAMVGVGLLIAQDQDNLRLGSAYGVEDSRNAEYVAALVGADLTVGNSYLVLTNGEDTFSAMLEAINGANRRISFETYIYESGEIADRFTAAFVNAAGRGVQVNLVLDSVGAQSMLNEHVSRLREAGCRVAEFNPTHWYELEEINYRTHRKILVVDGEIGFIGGVGIADHWRGHAQDPDHWRDTHVRMRGPAARLLEATFYENLAEEGDVLMPVLEELPVDPSEGGLAIVVSSSPTGGSNDLKRLYLMAIAMAHRSIEITSPYFVIDDSVRWALQEAVGRGVQIRILVEGDITDAMPVKYASRADYEWLLSRGVEIYEYLPTMMHAKTMVVDSYWSMFGSANFDNRSLELNDEVNVAVWSWELADRFLQDFEQDLKKSRRLELHSWRQRPRLEKVRAQFWRLFGELF